MKTPILHMAPPVSRDRRISRFPKVRDLLLGPRCLSVGKCPRTEPMRSDRAGRTPGLGQARSWLKGPHGSPHSLSICPSVHLPAVVHPGGLSPAQGPLPRPGEERLSAAERGHCRVSLRSSEHFASYRAPHPLSPIPTQLPPSDATVEAGGGGVPGVSSR